MEKVKNYVETVLQPKLQGDGGWVEYVSLDKDELTLMPYFEPLYRLD